MKSFSITTKAWYYQYLPEDGAVEEVMFMDNEHDGEVAMRWIQIDTKAYPRLECFSFNLLKEFRYIWEKLPENFAVEQFCEILKSCGFKDITAYERHEKKS